MLLQPRRPHFSVFERHAELNEHKRVHWEDWVALMLSRFKPLDYHIWDHDEWPSCSPGLNHWTITPGTMSGPHALQVWTTGLSHLMRHEWPSCSLCLNHWTIISGTMSGPHALQVWTTGLSHLGRHEWPSCSSGLNHWTITSGTPWVALMLFRFEPLDYHIWDNEWPSCSPGFNHWTITSDAPCRKSIINFNWSLRRLMSWKSPGRPSGKSCHRNTSTRRWRTSPSA